MPSVIPEIHLGIEISRGIEIGAFHCSWVIALAQMFSDCPVFCALSCFYNNLLDLSGPEEAAFSRSPGTRF